MASRIRTIDEDYAYMIHPDLCEVCQLREKHIDGTKVYPFCSKTCANKRASVNGGGPNATSAAQAVGSTAGNCDFCHNRPKYSDGTKTHDFCSKTCANSANRPLQRKPTTRTNVKAICQASGCQNPPQGNGPRLAYKYCSNIRILSETLCLMCFLCDAWAVSYFCECSQPCIDDAENKAVCILSGCQNPPQGNGPGLVYKYCSNIRMLSETLCLMCFQASKRHISHFCQCSEPCINDADNKGPMILEVSFGHVTFKKVAKMFKASWKHPGTTCPPVRRVYKIVLPKTSLAAYDAYRASVENQGQFVSTGRSAGNETLRWHGTRRICNIGDKGHTQFCSAPTCSLCCIMRTSFDVSLCGKETGWGRFGKGIYTSSISSKSVVHFYALYLLFTIDSRSKDYSHNDCISPLKAILLNKVVVGKDYKLLQDDTSLTSPPAGYDSVLGEQGGSLNYDELVVYDNDAIRPLFLVMYEPMTIIDKRLYIRTFLQSLLPSILERRY
ncbi:ADP-ribosylation [Phlegmacium glaucopus]|nr:ADP-ribosylation [Phlegmacium glaucopus]